jgi:hypothetical protein
MFPKKEQTKDQQKETQERPVALETTTKETSEDLRWF